MKKGLVDIVTSHDATVCGKYLVVINRKSKMYFVSIILLFSIKLSCSSIHEELMKGLVDIVTSHDATVCGKL